MEINLHEIVRRFSRLYPRIMNWPISCMNDSETKERGFLGVKIQKFPSGVYLQTPLEACTFDARFRNQSVFILDPRLNPGGLLMSLFWLSKPVISCSEEEAKLLLEFYYCICAFLCRCHCRSFNPSLCCLSPFLLFYVTVWRPCRLSKFYRASLHCLVHQLHWLRTNKADLFFFAPIYFSTAILITPNDNSFWWPPSQSFQSLLA